MSAAVGSAPAISDAWKAKLESCVAQFKDDKEKCSTWRAESDPATGVKCWSTEVKGISLRKFIAYGDLPGTPEQVSNLLYDSTLRMTWDTSYAGIDVVEPAYTGLPDSISEACIARLMLKRLLTISPRDFLILQCKAKDGAGGMTSVAFSVEDSRCPPDSAFVRGEVMPGSAWHVEPSPTGTGTRLYYVLLSDIKGWIPTAIVNSAVTTSIGDYYKNLRSAFAKDAAVGTVVPAAKTTA